MSLKARAFIATFIFAGFAVLGYAGWQFHTHDLLRFLCYLGIAVLASGMKVRLPGIMGTMSVNFLFILLCVIELGFGETAVIGTVASLVQYFWKSRSRPKTVQVAFNLSAIAVPTLATYAVYHGPLAQTFHIGKPLLLVAAASTYFFLNTITIAMVISLTEHKQLRKIWKECYFWSFPYYLVGGGIAGVVSWFNRLIGWELSLLIVPTVYLIYRSYSLYLGKLEHEKRHVEEIASLHLRTIEALALAIEAKDHTTHDHLRRVQLYAVEIAKELGISEEEQEALRAAALLHDIGKLAVPEHIISKPGRLTPEEFDKLKIHPMVGAEILERVQFPYPVAPIVRSHHEKWDGRGYPEGLKGEQIPMGARILAAVDCLDALASDRQYRRAMPLDRAMQQVVSESGTSFDPRIVEVLKRKYVDLEKMAQAQCYQLQSTRPLVHVRVDTPVQPARGFQQVATSMPVEESFLNSIAAARQEAQTLFELSHDLGNSLSLDETLSVLSLRLKKLVPYDSIAIYIRKNDRLVPAHVTGDNFRLFSSLEIPLGQGLSGWVAENRTPIINGNPSVEPGYLDDESKFSTLRSALAVPLDGLSGVIGVLALYKAETDAFTKDHLRILLAISSKVGLAMENALKYEQAENSAVTDYLTGLPNARSLFMHLDRELARCKRTNTSVAVMVCDIDGFKQINDRFGHLEGNKVLRTFAHSLRSVCREYDYVARMGGDEFVVIAPGLKREAAQDKTKHLNELAVEAGRYVCGEDILSLSVGTAFYAEDGLDAEQLLAEADRRMYNIKQSHHQQLRVATLARVAVQPLTVN
jgi:diguanylate cyclase (GGDEF)-like protein/putative nucleotidyltransferase with HDIG domain